MPPRAFLLDSPVLVAEGDAEAAGQLVGLLDDFQFRNVSVADSFSALLHHVKSKNYSLLILSDISGGERVLSLISNLRTKGKNTRVPILFLCNAGEQVLAQKAAAAGANGTIKRPVEARPLREALETVLDMFIIAKSDSRGREEDARVTVISPLETGRQLLASESFDEAEAALQTAIEKEGGSVDAYFGLAEIYLSRGDKEMAEKALREANRIEPHVRREFRARAPAFVRRGQQKLKDKKYEEALREFEASIFANPKSVAGYYGLGQAQQAIGHQNLEAAQRAFEQALAIDEEPEDLHIYNEMGLASRRKKEFDKALFAFDKAIAFSPEDPVLYYNKAMVYVALKSYQDAVGLLRKALEFDPEFSEARQALGNVMRRLKQAS